GDREPSAALQRREARARRQRLSEPAYAGRRGGVLVHIRVTRDLPRGRPRGYKGAMEAASPSADAAGGYPARLDIEYQEPLNRWLPLVKWLLAIPHYIMLFILYFAAWFALIAAFFVVLFTRRYPPALFQFLVGVMRWHERVT